MKVTENCIIIMWPAPLEELLFPQYHAIDLGRTLYVGPTTAPDAVVWGLALWYGATSGEDGLKVVSIPLAGRRCQHWEHVYGPCQSLSRYEVTRKIKTVGSRGGTCPIACDAKRHVACNKSCFNNSQTFRSFRRQVFPGSHMHTLNKQEKTHKKKPQNRQSCKKNMLTTKLNLNQPALVTVKNCSLVCALCMWSYTCDIQYSTKQFRQSSNHHNSDLLKGSDTFVSQATSIFFSVTRCLHHGITITGLMQHISQ